MEVPSESECLKIKTLLHDDLSLSLCNRNDCKNYQQINSVLKSLGFFNGPEKLGREHFFGTQLRYFFGTSNDIRTGMNGLLKALADYKGDDYVLLQNTPKHINSVKSHKLMQLNFDVNNRIFYHRFVSKLVRRLVVQKLRNLTKTELQRKMEEYKNQDSNMYGNVFEENQVFDLMEGANVVYRRLGSNNDHEYSFGKFKLGFYNCVRHPPIQMWYEDMDHTKMLGINPVKEDTLYYPIDRCCFTVDVILLQKRKKNKDDVIVVNFVQMTTMDKHGVSPGGFFAMFMLVKLIKIVNNCDVRIKFFFIVSEELYPEFNSPEADYLHNLFDNIDIYALKIEKNMILEIDDGTYKPNGAKNQQKETALKEKKTSPLVKKKEEKSSSQNEPKIANEKSNKTLNKTSSSLSEKILISNEKVQRFFSSNEEREQKMELCSEGNCSTSACLLFKLSEFNGINLKLLWSENIECVIDNLKVTVNDALDINNGGLDLSDDFDYLENILSQPILSVEESEMEKPKEEIVQSKENIISKIKKNVKAEETKNSMKNKGKMKSKKGKRNPWSSASQVESNETTSDIDLVVFENTFSQDVRLIFSNYLKICTLFYKHKSSRKKWAKGKVLNLLPEITMSINDDDKNVFEINFHSFYDEKEIFILLGCFDLHLLNIDIQFINDDWNVKLKFFPHIFKKQKNFLLKIKDILSHLGIYYNINQNNDDDKKNNDGEIDKDNGIDNDYHSQISDDS
jgi:hypothetical protein